MKLPVDELRADFEAALERGPVVLASPTGSGKSTQLPRWCAARGRVLVVEPRRVACRALASRVAELEGVELGREVGYSVRDEHCARPDTRILFATPGVVLRWLSSGGDRGFSTVVLDEFHERRLDVDLLLALNVDRRSLVVMSATMDVAAVATHLGATPVEGGASPHPVAVHYHAGGTLLPSPRGLEARLAEAVARARQDHGHVLVFLPGVGEIRAAAERLAGSGFEVLPLHGSLSLAEQSRVFAAGDARRLILATNVAETSITVPGVGVVIDSGLVRRTRYAAGRGFLTLVPVAADSAAQRTGRAGRTGPGVCYRLWSDAAILAERTPPELLRESLVPLLLAAAACGRRVDELRLLDQPPAHAVELAAAELAALEAIDAEGNITERGRRLFGLPLDPWLGRLLVAAEARGGLEAAVDLAAALETGRRLFARGRPELPEDDLRAAGCDAVALIRAVREGDAERHGLDRHALADARLGSRRLRRVFDLPAAAPPGSRVDREALARTVLAADPRAAHVARRRRGRVTWSNGGTEIELARDSAVDADKTEAIAVLATRALGRDARDTTIVATAATPVELAWIADAGIGRDRLARVAVEKGVAVAVIERVHAGTPIASREEEPTGELARAAIAELILRGSVLKGAAAAISDRLAAARLARRLRASGLLSGAAGPEIADDEPWLVARLAGLGVERGADLMLLAVDDVLPDDLDAAERALLDRLFPRHLDLADASYRVEYDLARSEVILHRDKGDKKTPPPPLAYLPRFQGFRIVLKHHSTVVVLREKA